VDLTHPFGVTAGEIVVGGDLVHTTLGQAVQVGRERGDEGLAFTGLHFGDPAEVQRGTTHHLNVVVTLTDGAAGGLANNGEGLHQKIVQGLAPGQTLTELDRLVGQRLVAQTA